MDGILLIDKPMHWTSFDVVNKIRRLVAEAEGKKPKQVKVGHTGTLDPLATGLLVILVGRYTKRATELTKLDKDYEVSLILGHSSTTGDAEGEIVAVSAERPTVAELQAVLPQFTGDLLQTPPAYSAIKVNGKRAYALAREGREVYLAPRPVHVYRNDLQDYTYPAVRLSCEVSSGTYIRSLVTDIGARLGTAAYMSSLRRTRVGKFSIDQAIPGDTLSIEAIANHLQLEP